MTIDRRTLFKAGFKAGLASVVAGGAISPVLAAADRAKEPDLAALAARLLAQNAGRVSKTDVVGIVNYAAPSWRPRFHLVNMSDSRISSLLVSHGRGSDPAHTGWLKTFSNAIGSNASSGGAYRTGALYVGKHGQSMRLAGLDADNSNAAARAIVVHGAWYVSKDMIKEHGKLGRSEGCFAFAESDLCEVLDRLGPGRLLYAGKF